MKNINKYFLEISNKKVIAHIGHPDGHLFCKKDGKFIYTERTREYNKNNICPDCSDALKVFKDNYIIPKKTTSTNNFWEDGRAEPIREMFTKKGKTLKEIGKHFGIPGSQAGHILKMQERRRKLAGIPLDVKLSEYLY